MLLKILLKNLNNKKLFKIIYSFKHFIEKKYKKEKLKTYDKKIYK